MLEYEAKIMLNFKGNPNIPEIYWYGVEGEFFVLVMELLGPSFTQLFSFCNK